MSILCGETGEEVHRKKGSNTKCNCFERGVPCQAGVAAEIVSNEALIACVDEDAEGPGYSALRWVSGMKGKVAEKVGGRRVRKS